LIRPLVNIGNQSHCYASQQEEEAVAHVFDCVHRVVAQQLEVEGVALLGGGEAECAVGGLGEVDGGEIRNPEEEDVEL